MRFLTQYTELNYLDFIIYKTNIKLSVSVKIAMLLDIANGMKYLHSKKVN